MRTVIFLWQPDDAAVHDLGAFDLAIAADSGVHTAARWGVKPNVAIGDFDSVNAESLDDDVEIFRYPCDKDLTDFELAANLAIARGATRVTVVCSAHDKADHALSLMLGLAGPHLPTGHVDAWIDETYATVVRARQSINKSQGKRVSLIPLFGDIHGVTTTGLRYPLQGAKLELGSAFSISNEMVADEATVSLTDGVLLLTQV